jgi:ribonuclease HI
LSSIPRILENVFDGASSKSRVGAGVVFKNPQGELHPHAFRLQFECTNNEAKYEALIQGLTLSHQMEIIDLIVMGDSELVVNHIQKKYNIKKEILKAYATRVWDLIQTFNSFNITFIPREKNQKDDSLAVSTSLFNPNHHFMIHSMSR